MGGYLLYPDIIFSQPSSNSTATSALEEKVIEPVEDENPPTPISARALKQYTVKICGSDMLEKCCILFAPFINGAVALAMSEALEYQ
jgi:hypothetical protein